MLAPVARYSRTGHRASAGAQHRAGHTPRAISQPRIFITLDFWYPAVFGMIFHTLRDLRVKRTDVLANQGFEDINLT